MSTIKISELDQLVGSPAAADELVIVDDTLTETKRITVADLFTSPPLTDLNVSGTNVISGTLSLSGTTVSNGGTVTTVDINGGTIDGATIGASSAGAGTFTNLTATGTVTLPNDSISGDKIQGGTIGSVTISSATINGGTISSNAVVKIKSTETASAVPTTSDVAQDELYVNLADGTLFSRDSSDNIVSVGGSTPFEDGAESTPSITFANDLDTGIYRIGTNKAGFTAGGDVMAGWDSNYFYTNYNESSANQYCRTENIQPTTEYRLGANVSYTAIRFGVLSTTNVGNITVGTSSVSYNTTSDYRLKENIVELTGGLDRLKQLSTYRFNFKEDTKTVDGFIAHEVQAIVPEAITGEKDAVDDNGEPVYQSIDQSKLVPLLVAAVKELTAKVEALESNNG